MTTQPIFLLLAAVPALWLSSCSNPHVEVLEQPRPQGPQRDLFLATNKLTPTTRAILDEQNLYATYRQAPGEAIVSLRKSVGSPPPPASRLALIELCANTGDRLAKENPRQAVGYHLVAAELASAGGLVPSGSPPFKDQFVAAYNHSCGQVARILFDSGHSWSQPASFAGPGTTYRLRCRTKGEGYVDAELIDQFVPSDYLEIKDLDLRTVRYPGVGGSMVAHRNGSPEHRAKNPFLPHFGISAPINATLEYSRGGNDVELALHDTMIRPHAVVAGRSRPLAVDLSTPIASLLNFKSKENIGWAGMLHPDRYADKMGLFHVEPFRPGQIPVILVHGLMSSPQTWVDALNQLRDDQLLRDRYQLLLYLYPTGFPIVYNAAALRHRLEQFQEFYDPDRSNPNLRKMVIIGHSMGGILSNVQIRSSGDTMTKRMFTRPIDDLNISDSEKTNLKNLLVYRANPDITRAVFVAAPHRGSDIAINPIGELGARLIKFPEKMLRIRKLASIDGMTPLGRDIARSYPNGVRNLAPRTAAQMTILEQPIRRGVSTHSIIGNHKMTSPLEESSDKVVPYWSSHLDGVTSEKVVNAKHTTITHDPHAIEELRRILYLHIGQPYKPLPADPAAAAAH